MVGGIEDRTTHREASIKTQTPIATNPIPAVTLIVRSGTYAGN